MKERINYFDNLKFVLIFFVVFGHFLIEYKLDANLNGLLIFIYSFHMPLFIFVSGYFSKNISLTSKQFVNILQPYLLGTIIYFVFTRLIDYKVFEITFTIPFEHLWYLLALFIWQIFVPVLSNWRAFYISLILCLIVPFFDDFRHHLTLARMLNFLPFFTLGLLFDEKWLVYFKDGFRVSFNGKVLKFNRNTLIIIASFTLLLFLFCTYLFSWRYVALSYKIRDYLVHARSYYRLWGTTTISFLINFMTYIIGFVISICFMLLVSFKEKKYTKIGAKTLVIFVFHNFFIFLTYQYFQYQFIIFELVTFLSSILILLILGNKYISRILEYFIKPYRGKR